MVNHNELRVMMCIGIYASLYTTDTSHYTNMDTTRTVEKTIPTTKKIMNTSAYHLQFHH